DRPAGPLDRTDAGHLEHLAGGEDQRLVDVPDGPLGRDRRRRSRRLVVRDPQERHACEAPGPLMTPLDPSDPHTPFVQELADAGDWAARSRYWMAHGLHAPALDRAIEIVHERARSGGDLWPVLAGFLEDMGREPFSFEREPPEVAVDELSADEMGTLELLLLLPLVALCEFGTQFPVASQSQAFQAGITAADRS